MARGELLALIVLGFAGSLVALDACSGFDEAGGTPAPGDDAASDGSTSPEAAPDAPSALDGGSTPCRIDAPFGIPRLLDDVSSANDEGMARLSADERSIYFDRYLGAAGPKVHMATRPDRASRFGAAVIVTAIDAPQNELHPSLSEDGLALYYSRYNPTGSYDIYVTRRASIDAQFGPSQAIIDTGVNETYAFVRGDRLWFTKQRGSSLLGIHEAAVDGGDVRAHAELSGDAGAHDYAAVLSSDSLTVYFSSERAGGPDPMNGELENIWYATRPSVTAPWSEPQIVPVINGGHRELAGWLSPDNCRLYFASNRVGSLDIYVAERAP